MAQYRIAHHGDAIQCVINLIDIAIQDEMQWRPWKFSLRAHFTGCKMQGARHCLFFN